MRKFTNWLLHKIGKLEPSGYPGGPSQTYRKMKRVLIALCVLSGLACIAESNSPLQQVASESRTNTVIIASFSMEIPVRDLEELESIEKKLESIGFTKCQFKSGNNFSGYSLAGEYRNAEFRVGIVVKKDDAKAGNILSALMTATAGSQEDAEDACRHLHEYLNNEENRSN